MKMPTPFLFKKAEPSIHQLRELDGPTLDLIAGGDGAAGIGEGCDNPKNTVTIGPDGSQEWCTTDDC